MSEPEIWWRPQIEAIARELSRLAIACDIDFFAPGAGERVLRNDESVCGRSNAAAFRQLRQHLMALYEVEGDALERIGPDELRQTLDEVVAAIRALRSAGRSDAGD